MNAPLHVLFIIDSSSSMAPKAYDVQRGFNEYIEQLRKDTSHDYAVTVVTFDTKVKLHFRDLPLAKVPPLDSRNYRTGGDTALYDAIGNSIEQLTKMAKLHNWPYGKDRILVIVMTDGENNSSHRFKDDKIQEMIRIRKEAGNWTFVYLGEDQDAWSIASKLGFERGNVIAYNADATIDVFQRLAVSTRTYSANDLTSTSDFIEEITIFQDEPDKLP